MPSNLEKATLLLLLAAATTTGWRITPAHAVQFSQQQQHVPNINVLPTAFRYPNFLNRPNLNLVGDARPEVSEIVVAGPGRRETGAVWFSQTFDATDGFFAEFALSVTQVDNNGGEGIAFVVQRDSAYALGRGLEGMGYENVGEGIAVEFDGRRDSKDAKDGDGSAKDAGAHVAVRNALRPGTKLHADHVGEEKQHGGGSKLAVPLPNLAELVRPVEIRVEYAADTGELVCWFNVAKLGEPVKWFLGVKRTVDAFLGGNAYWVGFTAATGADASARFAVTKFKFGVKNTFHGCVHGFTGPECGVTDEEARRECPRRETCFGCIRDVYNCAWCGGGKNIKSGGECTVGTAEALKDCSNYVSEDLGCSSPLSLIWLWISLAIVGVVLVFGVVLVRTLPRTQAFRAVSLLVSLGCGAFLGMAMSYMVAASLVEISTTPAFSICFGVFFFYLAWLITNEVNKSRARAAGWKWDHVASAVAAVWISLAGVLCFALDKRWVRFMPEAVKVIMYCVLSAALTFCITFSGMDLSNEAYERCTQRRTATPGLAEMMDTERREEVLAGTAAPGGSGPDADFTRVLTVARNKARYALLILASLISGLYFGLMFGLMRIEEEPSIYRASLMIKQESLYTFPAGALIGGVSGLLLQLINMPMQTDVEIDRIIADAKDDL